MSFLTDPLSYDFMRYALLMGLLIGAFCPVIGAYLVVQRMTMLGDVIAHAVLPGLVLANFWQIGFAVGAFASGMIGAAVINWIRTRSRVKIDAAMALTFASFFALGILLLSLLETGLDLESLLFGDILSVTVGNLWQTAVIALILVALVACFYRPLLFFTFDRIGAAAAGLPVAWLEAGLMAAITLTIVVGLQMVGVILVIALMVGPAATAYLLVKELHQMMICGAAVGAIASTVGIYLSYYFDWPTGPAIALVVFAGFLLALLFSPSQGILTAQSSSKIQN
ncbi:MAG: metal ABC transporter permease [Leptolyngbya sp. SIO4C1]|nr:metal ABC transporter permease [Leptolyngbya sp. SIO4C1]